VLAPARLLAGPQRWAISGVEPGPGRCRQIGGQAGAECAVQGEISRGIAELGLGAQHEHRQPLERWRKQVAVAEQQDLFRAGFPADEARQHAALGRAVAGQPCLALAQQHEVLRQLSMQEGGGIGALGPDHAPVIEPGQPLQGGGIEVEVGIGCS
jgi:hypothetical protein